MVEPHDLTYKKKVLLYLRDHYDIGQREEYPVDVTQKGIARAVGMRRTHVSRVVNDLIDRGLLKEDRGHVEGNNRKLKVYSLSGKGRDSVKDILKELGSSKVSVIKDNETFTCSVTDLEGLTDGDLDLLKSIDLLEESSQPLDLDELGPKSYMVDMEDAPVVDELYGRGDVLTEIDDWFQGDVTVAVLKGRMGYGASSTARRFIDSVEDKHILWIDVQKGDVRQKMEVFYSNFSSDNGELSDKMEKIPSVVVLDDYYDVEDELVDFLVELLDDMETSSKSKILVTTREGLPVYERFYHREHLIQKKVVQIDVPPLRRDEAEMILGKRLEPGALRRIMLMTKGSPLILRLLREGKVKEIEKKCALVKEQISLLMFLKEKTE